MSPQNHTTEDGRPAVTTRRPFRGAPDDADDPVLSRAPAAAAVAETAAAVRKRGAPRKRVAHEFVVPEDLPVELPRRPRGTVTVAVNFKLLPEFKQVLEDVADATGATQTEALEAALLYAYGRGARR